MKITKQARRDAKALFQACRTNGVVDEARVRSLTGELIARKPRGYLPILNCLLRLVTLDGEQRRARVESALALTHAQEASLREQLTARYGEGLNFTFTVNPALIGGMRVRIGSDVFDGSVQGRLTELAENFRAA